MQEPDIEGVANHDDPESCAVDREGEGEALTGARMGTDIEPRNQQSGAPTTLAEAEGNMTRGRYREPSSGPARSKTRNTCATFLRENREIPTSPTADGEVGRTGKAHGRTPVMNNVGKSDRPILPAKTPNKVGQPTAEAMEERGLAKGNTGGQNALRRQSREGAPSALERVRQAAKREKGMRFTALLHHVDNERLREAFYALNRDAAPGVDGVTWQHYAAKLEDNLRDLHGRLQSGAYRAKPTRRAYIPKSDGRQRPLGIAALEDKVVQRAVVEVLNAIYEADFLGFSYGFRPGRSQHDALDAVAFAVQCRKVSFVLDADIRGYFDAVCHEWLVKFVEHRIADRRVLRLIQKWLSAGVMENGQWTQSELGSPQGATASPLLANIYLHYALDQWVQQWRTRYARGEVIIVRYCDDFIIGFQHRSDAERFQRELRDRLAKFKLELHPDKTRLIAFGRYALSDRRERGLRGAPETFDFLGFSHRCGCTRSKPEKFLLLRHTIKKRMTAKLQEVSTEMRRRRHWPIAEQGRWLASVVRGHIGYYGVPTNVHALQAFRTSIAKSWYRSLRRRGQRRRINWTRMKRVVARWLPPVCIVHPWPQQRLNVRTQGKSPVR